MNLLEIDNLKVNINDKEIINGLNLKIDKGQVHALMGQNGCGKSTLAKAITGHFAINVTGGSIKYKNLDLLNMEPEERANRGIFMSFQSPREIPGVNNLYFLKTSLNLKREFNGQEELNSAQMLKKIKTLTKELGIDDKVLKRYVNDGFSGGEKKTNELLQMLLLEPDLIILDEIDSGLDIDALKRVGEGINRLLDGKTSVLIITHYKRVLDYIKPDVVHVMAGGKIVKTGDISIVNILEDKGYGGIDNASS
ncbi:Fe-S cluster assembly ATPase SufC [Thiospirochaeta perfilievii]|uniref:Fe-S cluster assembly ATPase SufC n=1 Tax=Thiospirochaeta perfilievii TaxID=252967 RepID=A0A5C1QD29_9SPIO|nr:Fe-S cluster assembly ATPase SufC [Thiospirochaeta perfilievii]QEN04970.1 Fe-S cluster assembly ATPase SufC [Thiospirochaeta perfilievii]